MTAGADRPLEPDDAPEADDELEPGLPGPLPDVVRARVIALAADALGRLAADQLPASLKRVASFAPNRRARLAGSQIATVLEADAALRERLATQVRGQAPELAAALESGAPPAAADPVELAALGYLLRPPGWVALVAGAAELVDAERAHGAGRQVADQVDRLRRQLEAATAELRSAKALSRTQLAELKSENADLRRKLGEVRARAKAAEQRAVEAEQAAADARAQAGGAGTAAEAEARRLRSRVEELERELAQTRRSERSSKDVGTLRARLLLDSLLAAAQGLRRELALPAVEGAPADAVQARVAERGSRTSSSTGSMASDDPALLAELVNLPRVHVIVDGYNVTKNAWPDASLEVQRDRLLAGLAPLAARSGAEVTAVFDAADKEHRPLVKNPRGVRVLFSPVGVIADEVIRQLVAAEPAGRPVVVVSSDQEVARDVARAGAWSVASGALNRLLSRV